MPFFYREFLQQHSLYGYLTWLGISARELEEIQWNATPPDVLGINYYVTSERYLDDQIQLYPDWLHGGNGQHTYVDLEAIRVCADEPAGHVGILQEVWDRYHLPLALTEVHLGGHREQQLRWWMNAWNATQTLRQRGVNVSAITAWSLLGSFNCHNLVTRDDGLYESGVFGVRGLQPRPTVLAQALQSLTQQGTFDHPVLYGPGWWQSEHRLLHPPVHHGTALTTPILTAKIASKRTIRPLPITGGNGTLAQAFQRICESRNIPFLAISRDQLDIADTQQVRQALSEMNPWSVINTAGYVRVDDAEQDPEECLRANALGPAILAELCETHGIRLLSFSSDLVFNGEQSIPYLESDIPDPLNTYGASKAEGEVRILEANDQALIVRTSAFFGPWDSANFLTQVECSLSTEQGFVAAEDVRISPTYVPDLVNVALELLIDWVRGIWHLSNQGEVS